MHAANHAYDLLSTAQVGLVHRSALRVLDEMGMEVQNRQLLEALRDHGAKVDFDTQRAILPAPVIERFIADCPKYDWSGAQGRVRGSAGVYHSRYHDPLTGDLVPWTEAGMASYFALARRLPRVEGASMLGCRVPVPAPLEPLYERYYCWKHGAAESGSIHTDALCPYVLALYEALAADRGEPLQDLFRGAVYLIPALKLGRHEAYQVAYFRDRGLRVSIGQSMATMGATAPVTLAGAVTLNLAEQLALSFLNSALFGDMRLHLGASLAPMDMRTMIRPFGRPEMTVANLMTAQMARYYGASFGGHAGLTDAKLPSVEAGAQKALSAIPTLLAGGNLWMDVGLLATDEVCSPIQMVLDSELLGALDYFTRELPVDEEAIGLETILEAGPGGQYLDRLHTAWHFRDEIWDPALWSRRMLGAWLAEGAHTDADRARDVVLQAQTEADLAPEQGRMSERLEESVLGVIEDARRAIALW